MYAITVPSPTLTHWEKKKKRITQVCMTETIPQNNVTLVISLCPVYFINIKCALISLVKKQSVSNVQFSLPPYTTTTRGEGGRETYKRGKDSAVMWGWGCMGANGLGRLFLSLSLSFLSSLSSLLLLLSWIGK